MATKYCTSTLQSIFNSPHLTSSLRTLPHPPSLLFRIQYLSLSRYRALHASLTANITMASFKDLPNELLDQIPKHLCAGKIDHFDPVATRDLQNLRLISRLVSSPGSSLLMLIQSTETDLEIIIDARSGHASTV